MTVHADLVFAYALTCFFDALMYNITFLKKKKKKSMNYAYVFDPYIFWFSKETVVLFYI